MKPILFGNCLKKDKYIYGFAKDFNMLCCWNIDNKQLIMLGSIPGEKINIRNLSIKLILDGNDIYIIPFNAKMLWIYNIDSGKWESIELKDGEIGRKFAQAFIYRNELYMIGAFYKAIVKVNIRTKEICYIREPYDIIEQKHNNKDKIFFWDYCFKDEKTIYFPACLYDIVFEFSLENEKISTHFVGDISNGHDIIVKQDDKYWLAPRYGGKFICWDGRKVVDEFSVPINTRNDCFGCSGGYIRGSVVTFYSYMQKMTVSYDFKTNRMIDADNRKVYFCNFDKGNLLVQDSTGIILQLGQECQERYDVRMPENFLREIAQFLSNPVRENFTFSLDFWLNNHVDSIGRSFDNEENFNGLKIWNVSRSSMFE